jgi:8-oxo-dGTP pyrophosphatase MutT (NUDIX family)
MHLFINDKPVRVITTEEYSLHAERYHLLLTNPNEKIKATDLEGKVAVIEPNQVIIQKLLDILRTKKLKKMQSLTFVVQDKKVIKDFIKSQFKIVKAAGGLVQKDGQLLLMFRLGKWDFPKGKAEKLEKPEETAVREVEEECGIKVELVGKIGATWHTYTLNGSKILKKTKWYAMQCLDDSTMMPQEEEGIEQLIWSSPEQAEKLLATTYKSIRWVFDQYFMKYKV